MEIKQAITQFLSMNSVKKLRSFQKDPYVFFDVHKPENTTKPVFMSLGFRRFFLCYDPGHARHVLQEQKHKYDKSSLVLKKIKNLSGSQGLIQLQGQEALKVRQTSAKLMSPAGMDRLVQKVDAFTKEIFPFIDEAIAKNEPLDVVPHLTRIVLRTAGVFVLNYDLLSESDELNDAFVDLNRRAGEGLRSMVDIPFTPAKRRSLNTIHRELARIIEGAAKDEEPSLLKALLLRGEEPSFVRDQLKAFMFAGYDTTASSLNFATHLVASDMSAQTRIALENEQMRDLSYRDLKKSMYVHAVYSEALRLYPSAYFLPRQSNQDDILGGVKIPRSSQIFLSVRHIQRHPDYFEHPDKFIPERFLTDIKEPFSFIPFGGGPRICIGAELAKLEATLVLQNLCKYYEMRPARPHPPKIEALITAHTRDPLPIYFKKRMTQKEILGLSS